MSRTYRLKNMTLRDWWEKQRPNSEAPWINCTKPDVPALKWLNIYFGDTNPGERRSQPKKCRKQYAKITAARNRQELHNTLWIEDYEPNFWNKERIIMSYWGWD